MKKLLNILGGGCGGCKKILAVLMVAVMMATMAPVVFAVVEYEDFEYENLNDVIETHYLPPSDFLEGVVNGVAASEDLFSFFFRTNPTPVNTDKYLYGYGYGLFAGEDLPGWGYGFGFGYDYFYEEVDGWCSGEACPFPEKLGMGLKLGDSFGEFKLLATDGVTEELPVAMSFAISTLVPALAGAAINLPAGLFMTASDPTWEGELTLTVAETAGSVSGFDSAVSVNVATCAGCAVTLSAPVVVVIPNDDFEEGGLVKLETVAGEQTVDECTAGEYNNELDMDEPTAYTLDEDSHCYKFDASNVYIATNHFTEFAAGEAEADAPGGGGPGGGSYSKKTAEVAEGTPESVSDFKDLLTLVTSDWRYAVVQQMLDLGLFQGKTVNGERVFDMEGNMTRGMAATVICRYMGCDENAVITVPSFLDVPNDAYYAAAVSYLKDNGIVQGKTPANFDPAGTVTRAQFFKMVVKAYMHLNPAVAEEWNALLAGTTTYFEDVPTTVWYAGYMNLAANKGLLKGSVENGKRYAKGGKDVTRVQAGAMIGYVLGL